ARSKNSFLRSKDNWVLSLAHSIHCCTLSFWTVSKGTGVGDSLAQPVNNIRPAIQIQLFNGIRFIIPIQGTKKAPIPTVGNWGCFPGYIVLGPPIVTVALL